jgi:hypothetical protein
VSNVTGTEDMHVVILMLPNGFRAALSCWKALEIWLNESSG